MSLNKGPWNTKLIHQLGNLNKAHPHLRGCILYYDFVETGKHPFTDGVDASNGTHYVSKLGAASTLQPDHGSSTNSVCHYSFGASEVIAGGDPSFHIRDPGNVTTGTFMLEDRDRIEAGTFGSPRMMADHHFYKFTNMCWRIEHNNYKNSGLSCGNDSTGATDSAFDQYKNTTGQAGAGGREDSWTAVDGGNLTHNDSAGTGDLIFHAFVHTTAGWTQYWMSSNNRVLRSSGNTWDETKGSDYFEWPTAEVMRLNHNANGVGAGGPAGASGAIQARIYKRSLSATQIEQIARNPWAPRTQ
jgi:hypothetical protein